MNKRIAALIALILALCLSLSCAGLAETADRNETDEVAIATYRDAIQGSGDAYYCWEGAYVWEALTRNNGGVLGAQ